LACPTPAAVFCAPIAPVNICPLSMNNELGYRPLEELGVGQPALAATDPLLFTQGKKRLLKYLDDKLPWDVPSARTFFEATWCGADCSDKNLPTSVHAEPIPYPVTLGTFHPLKPKTYFPAKPVMDAFFAVYEPLRLALAQAAGPAPNPFRIDPPALFNPNALAPAKPLDTAYAATDIYSVAGTAWTSAAFVDWTGLYDKEQSFYRYAYYSPNENQAHSVERVAEQIVYTYKQNLARALFPPPRSYEIRRGGLMIPQSISINQNI